MKISLYKQAYTVDWHYMVIMLSTEDSFMFNFNGDMKEFILRLFLNKEHVLCI